MATFDKREFNAFCRAIRDVTDMAIKHEISSLNVVYMFRSELAKLFKGHSHYDEEMWKDATRMQHEPTAVTEKYTPKPRIVLAKRTKETTNDERPNDGGEVQDTSENTVGEETSGNQGVSYGLEPPF